MSVAPQKREPRLQDPPAVASVATGRQTGARPRRGIAAARRHAGRLETLPVIISLMSTWVIFELLDHNHRFLTAANLSNMVVQIAGTGIMAIGITLVLLLGEIDLSIGSMSGLAAAILTSGTVSPSCWPSGWWCCSGSAWAPCRA